MRRLVLAIAPLVVMGVQTVGPAHAADGDPRPGMTSAAEKPAKVEAIESYLKHAYSVYLALRACTELSAEQNDRSFLPSVALEEARRTLRAIDAATAEVRIDSNAAWAAAAPRAEVTAEALKAEPNKHVEDCHRVGGLFRIDASNLQPLLQSLGAKTTILSKDY